MSPARPRVLLSTPIRSPLGAITAAGVLRKRGWSGWKTPRVLGSYALVLITAGRGSYEDVRGHRQELKAGDLVWVFPELGHSYSPLKDGAWDEFFVVFNGPVFDLLRSAGVIDPARPVWRAAPVARWKRALAAAVRPALSNGAALRRVAALQQVVVELASVQPDVGGDTERAAWLTEACRRIEQAPAGPVDWSALSAGLGMSYESFRKKFTAQMGCSPGRHRLVRLIDRACALLLTRQLTHKEIAAQLGFADEFHFSKAFKQRIGIAPAVFRAMARNGSG